MTIKDTFDKDKSFLNKSLIEYFQNGFPTIPLDNFRAETNKALARGDFSSCLEHLEFEKDKLNGIILTKITDGDNAPVLIRDARKRQDRPDVLGTESFEMQYINIIRTGNDVIDCDEKLTTEQKEELKEGLKRKAVAFMDPNTGFHSKNKDMDQESLSKLMLKEIDGISAYLEVNGIKKAYMQLDKAMDFQNYNDTHYNIATISSINGNTIIEAEIAMKGQTDEQKAEYINHTNKPWFKALSPIEQKLTEKYLPEILGGKHVMPTQLRQLVGMKNAFEKITFCHALDQLKTLHTVKHAGTLASLSDDKEVRQYITNLNAMQAKEWVGNETTLHANTLNSGPTPGRKVPWLLKMLPILTGNKNDRAIVSLTSTSSKQAEFAWTGTAFNAARGFGRHTNNLTGSENFVKKVIESIKEQKLKSALKSVITPQSFVSRIFNSKSSNIKLEEALKSATLTDDEKQIIRDTISLSATINKAHNRSFLDPSNSSLEVSTQLGLLASKLKDQHNSNAFDNAKLPKEEMLVMCASGKDRTGLAMYDQSAQAISRLTNIPIHNIDRQLLATGHTAQQAGGVFSGGATVGCFGTKSENKAGLPSLRAKFLKFIIQISAKTNSVKAPSQKAIEEAKALKATETASKAAVDAITSTPATIVAQKATNNRASSQRSSRGSQSTSQNSVTKQFVSVHPPQVDKVSPSQNSVSAGQQKNRSSKMGIRNEII